MLICSNLSTFDQLNPLPKIKQLPLRSLTIIFLGVMLALGANAQILTIKDGTSHEVMPDVALQSDSPRAFTTTNAAGQADISAFIGSQQILISHIGYKSQVLRYSQLDSAKFMVRMEPNAVSIDQFVVSATRWKHAAKDIPEKVMTITTEDVAYRNPQTAADLLGSSGGVFIQKSQQGGGSPMIRGFSTNRLLYVIDGVRMNTAIFRSGNLQNVISLDPLAIERTEVLFGPGSVIYGSDAIGGVMNFSTLEPTLSLTDTTLLTGKALVRYASANDEITGHFDVNVGWRKWALVTSISANDYSDLRMGSHGPDEYLRPSYVQRQDSMDVVVENNDPQVQNPSGYSQMNLMQKVRFKPNKEWDLQYGFHYSETSDYARYDRHLQEKDGLPRYGQWDYGPQVWMMNNLGVMHSKATAIYDRFSLRLAHQHFEESRISRGFNDPIQETRTEEVQAFSLNLDLNKRAGIHELFYGAEVVFNDVTSTGLDENIDLGTAGPGPSRYPQSTWLAYGVYVSDQITLSEKTNLRAGVRYDRFGIESEFDTTFYPFPFVDAEMQNGAVTGSLGAVHRPTDKWVLSAIVATGFRSPNVDDAGKVFDSEPGAVVVPNPELKAEYAYNFDVGIAKIFGNSVKVDLTVYYTRLNNALVRQDYTLNGMDSIMYDGELSKVQAMQNASEAQVYGIQAGLEVKLAQGLQLSSVLNYQQGEEDWEGGITSPSRHAPPLFGITRLVFRQNGLRLELSAQYSAERSFEDMPLGEISKDHLYAMDNNGNPYSPSWYTLDLRSSYAFNQHFSLIAAIENLTDQRYRPYSSGMTGAGRNFVLAVRAAI